MRLPALLAATALLALGACGAQEDYPDKPITLIVPFSAGGPTDTVARLIAKPMSRELGQRVLVQSIPGAGGTVGAAQVAKAKPDGYKILLHHIGMATAPTLDRSLPYDPLKDFEAIGLVTDGPMTIIARKDFEPNTLQELVDYVKANKDVVTYANAGIGTASHLCGMLFMEAIDTQLTTIPYQGTGPALADLLKGQVDFMCDQTTNTMEQIRSGNVKAYAVTTDERLPSLPNLPTTVEAGLGEFQIGVWHGLYAPAGTPKAVIGKLTTALQTALKDEKVIQQFAKLGTTPVSQEQATPEGLREKLETQIEFWRPIIQEAGFYAN